MRSLDPHTYPWHRAAQALLAVVAVTGCAGRTEGEPVFCYAWLTDITCYPEPLAEGARRLVGVYLRDPLDPAGKEYWLKRAGAPMSR